MRTLAAMVVAVVCGQTALAAPKTVVVASGDCRHAELLTGMASFHEALKQSWADEVFAPEEVLRRLRPRPTLSLEDVRRQIESTRTLWYANDQNGPRVTELLRQTLSELEKISPQNKPWPTLVDAMLLQANVLFKLDKRADAEALLERVARIEPTLTLDKDTWRPTMREAFSAKVSALAKARKAPLMIQSMTGAEVFIDGKSFGKAPLKVELVPGTYRVSVVNAEQVSFPHVVTVPNVGSAQIDIAFEGALMSSTPLCLSTTTAPAEALAQKLGDAVGAEKVVVFWQENRDGPPFYRALILRGGIKEREGGVQMSLEGKRPIEQLAHFVVTGDAKGIVGPIAAVAPPALMSASELPVSPPLVETAPATSSARIIGYSLLGVGAATAAIGAVVYIIGETDRTALATLTASGTLPPVGDARHAEALAVLARVNDNRGIGFGVLGAGVGLAVSGALTLWLFPTDTGVSVAPSSGGASVSFSGRF